MFFSKFPSKVLLVAVAASGAMNAAVAVSCEELRATIEDKIEKNGVKNFTVSIVITDDTVSGQVVGTCEGGSKKLVYSKIVELDSSPSLASATPSPASASKSKVITECADGRVITSGSCRQ